MRRRPACGYVAGVLGEELAEDRADAVDTQQVVPWLYQALLQLPLVPVGLLGLRHFRTAALDPEQHLEVCMQTEGKAEMLARPPKEVPVEELGQLFQQASRLVRVTGKAKHLTAIRKTGKRLARAEQVGHLAPAVVRTTGVVLAEVMAATEALTCQALAAVQPVVIMVAELVARQPRHPLQLVRMGRTMALVVEVVGFRLQLDLTYGLVVPDIPVWWC